MLVKVQLALPGPGTVLGYERAIDDVLRELDLSLRPQHPGTQDARMGSQYIVSVPDRETADRAATLLRSQQGVERVEIEG